MICSKSDESPLNYIGADNYSYIIIPESVHGIIGKIAYYSRYLWQILKSRFKKVDIFYICEAPMCISALIGLLGVPRKKVVYHFQNFIDPSNHPFQTLLEKRMCRRAGLVITNDTGRARFIQSNYRLREAPLVIRTAMLKEWPGNINSESMRSKLLNGKDNISMLVLHQGPFSNVRMSIQVLDAISLLPKHYALVVTGNIKNDSYTDYCKSHAKKIGISDRIIYTGYLHFNNLPNVTAACDVGLLIYPNDGIGNYFKAPGRLTQYMACGIPIVSSSFPAIECLILRYDLGATCNPECPESIASAIIEATYSSENRRSKHDNLRKVFEEHFAFEHDGKMLMNAVYGLFSKKSG